MGESKKSCNKMYIEGICPLCTFVITRPDNIFAHTRGFSDKKSFQAEGKLSHGNRTNAATNCMSSAYCSD